MSGILKYMFYPEGWDHAASTDFCLNPGHKHLSAFKRTFASNVLAAASARAYPTFSCGKLEYDPVPSCLIWDNLLEFSFFYSLKIPPFFLEPSRSTDLALADVTAGCQSL